MTGVRDIGIDIRSKQGKSQPDSINTKKNKQMSHTKCVYLQNECYKKILFHRNSFFHFLYNIEGGWANGNVL